MPERRTKNDINIKHKQAFYRYELLDRYIAGIILKGTEIKSIREGLVNLREGYGYIHKNEIFIKGIHIAPYSHAGHYNHEALRDRKLLLKKIEIRKLTSHTQEKGLVIIPLRLFINPRGYAKIEVALARGKKLHDKRATIRDRDMKRELDRIKYT